MHISSIGHREPRRWHVVAAIMALTFYQTESVCQDLDSQIQYGSERDSVPRVDADSANPASGSPRYALGERDVESVPVDLGEERLDLHALFMQELSRAATSRGISSRPILSVRAIGDGHVEVLNSSGISLGRYPLSQFAPSATMSSEILEARDSRRQALQEKRAGQLDVSEQELEEGRLEAEERSARKKKSEEEQEKKWQEDLAAKSKTYVDRRTGEKVNAVKIDAREIREDGKYIIDGRETTPVRLYDRQRGRFEMAVPVTPLGNLSSGDGTSR